MANQANKYLNVGIRIPMVHLNGSAKANLLDDNEEALEDLRKAIASLRRSAPHGRDYYTQDSPQLGAGSAFEEVRAQHVDRLARLESVLAELEAIRSGISIQRR